MQSEIESMIELPSEAIGSITPSIIEYPDTLTSEDMYRHGYLEAEMLPLGIDKAIHLFTEAQTVYLLYPDNTEAVAYTLADINKHDGIFGIERKDWEKSNAFKELIAEKESAKNPAQQAAEKQAEAPRKEPTAKKPAKPKRRNRGEDR